MDTESKEDGGAGFPEVTDSVVEHIRSAITVVPDFPKPGVTFFDYTSLLADYKAFSVTIDALRLRYKDQCVTHVASCEARGFALGAPLALALKCSFVPLRHPRKLPRDTTSVTYGKGFTSDRMEVHSDALDSTSRVVIIDDVIASGKTMVAAADLVVKCGGFVVECAVLADLSELRGKARMRDHGYPLFIMAPTVAPDGATSVHAAGKAT